MKAIKYFFKSFDVFGQPIQLSLNRKYLRKSTFGGFLTFSMILFFLILVSAGFQDLVNRKNIITYTQDDPQTSAPAINFKTNEFSFAITFNDPILNDPRYFNIELLQSIWTINSDGQKNFSYFPHYLTPCNPDLFNKELLPSLLQKNNNLSQFLCPIEKNLEIKVAGGYSSSFYAFFWIRLSKCQNSDNNTCVSDDLIEERFTLLNRRVYLNVYFSNNIISPNNFENPINSFLDDRMFVLVDRSSTKEKSFYLTQNKIFTDTSILSTNYLQQYDTFYYDNVYDETIYKLSESDLNQSNVEYANLYFRSNIVTKMHSRTFEKIGKFIGYIGGFWSILYLFFSMIGKEYNQYKLLMKMANYLYTFPKENKKHANELNERVSSLNKVHNTMTMNENFDRKIEKFIEDEKGGKLSSSFGSLIYQKIYGFFSVFKYFAIFFNEIVRIREHALMAIQKDTDIVYLLTKIKEINKFKSLFFNKFQTKLFEHFLKERISASGRERTNVRTSSLMFMKKNDRRKSFIENKFKKQEIYKQIIELYDCFSMVWEKNDEDDDSKKLNDKILKLFDKGLMDIFKERCAKDKNLSEISSRAASQVDVLKTSIPKPSEFKKAQKKKTIEFDKLMKEKV